MTEAGTNLKAIREGVELSLDDAAYLARQQLAHVRCSRQTLRNYETNTEEERWNPEVLLALAGVYGVSVETLSPVAAERLHNVLALATRYAPRDSNPEPSDSGPGEHPHQAARAA